MAKQHYVTRRITTTIAEVLVHNTETKETFKKEIVLPRSYSNDNDILSAARNNYETDTEKIACVLSSSVNFEKRVMTEEDFVKNSFVKVKKEDLEDEDFEELEDEELEETEE